MLPVELKKPHAWVLAPPSSLNRFELWLWHQDFVNPSQIIMYQPSWKPPLQLRSEHVEPDTLPGSPLPRGSAQGPAQGPAPHPNAARPEFLSAAYVQGQCPRRAELHWPLQTSGGPGPGWRPARAGAEPGAAFLSLGICTLGTAASWGPVQPLTLRPQGGAPRKRQLPGRLGTCASRGPTVLFIKTQVTGQRPGENRGVSLRGGKGLGKAVVVRVPPWPAGFRPTHFTCTDTADRGRPGHPACCGLKPVL